MLKVTELVSDKARMQTLHSINKYLLSGYYMPGTVVHAATGSFPILGEAFSKPM